MTLTNLKNNKRFIYTLSFLIPTFLLLIICILTKVYPFGNNTLAIWDCKGQYIDFLSYFKTIFTDTNDFFYTFSKNIGGDMVGLSAYYLLSPLNLILLLFPNQYLPVALFLIILVKIGLCGLTFNCFINNINIFDWKSLIFSTSYALIGYNMAYFWDIMWIDGVILLPLIALGINLILKSNKPHLYVISLLGALVTNYYIGFMLCIFSAIYFVYSLFISVNNINKFKLYIRKILTYTLSSLISVGLSSFILIPTFMTLQGGKASFSISALEFRKNYSFFDLFTKFYTKSMTEYQLMYGLPNIFCGVLITILVILYLFNSKILLREKIFSVGFIFILIMSFYINTFNLIWHGFNPPSWFPYRYSFMFSFLLIYIAYRSFLKLKDGTKNNHIIYCAIMFIALSVMTFRHTYDFVNIKSAYLDTFLMLCLCLLLYLFRNNNRRNNAFIIAIALIQIGNLSLNSFYSIRELQNSCAKMDEYSTYIQETKSVIDRIKLDDSSFYRLEKNFYRTKNDPMQFNYNGLSHFSSSEKTFVKSFLGKMGFRNNGSWAYYNYGSTVSVDCLLGVKYLLCKEDVNKQYKNLFTQNDITAKENPYALPLGFAVSNKVLGVDFGTTDLFKIQNDIFNSMTDNNFSSIFSSAKLMETNLENLTKTTLTSSTKYEKIYPSCNASISYKIKVNNENALYTYINAPQVQNAEIFINNSSLGKYFDIYRWDIVSLGSFKTGDVVTFKIQVNDNSLEMNDPLFYYENLNILKQNYDKLSSQPCNLQKISSSHLKGKIAIKSDNQYLMCTIPYEKDWKVTIDNKEIRPIKVFDTFMATPISKGEHNIEFKYVPSGLYLGISISIFSIIISLIYLALHRKY